MALQAFSELVRGEVSHLPHVHGNQCLRPCLALLFTHSLTEQTLPPFVGSYVFLPFSPDLGAQLFHEVYQKEEFQ